MEAKDRLHPTEVGVRHTAELK